MNHQGHGNQEAQDGGAGSMGHGGGLKGLALMVLCCLPMIAIILLVAVGLFR